MIDTENPYAAPIGETGKTRYPGKKLRRYFRGFVLSIVMSFGGFAIAAGLIIFLITFEPPKTPVAEVLVSTVLGLCAIATVGGLVAAIVFGVLLFSRWISSHQPSEVSEALTDG